jgi:tetratricopeptide (TPR) repeat protein
MKDEYEQARAYYGQALVFGEQIGDFTVRLNTLANLARLEKSLDNHTAACDYYRRTLDLAESHPFFKTHPVVEGWRRAYAELECESAD